MVIYVVKAAFVPISATGESPANAGVARLYGVSPCPVPDSATALPKQARYQLRYTRESRPFGKVSEVVGRKKSATVTHYSGFLCGMQDAIRKETETRLCEKPRPMYRNVFLICGQTAQKSERGAASVADVASNKVPQPSSSSERAFCCVTYLKIPHACGALRHTEGVPLSVSKNLFDTLGDCQKGSEDEQLTPVGVYRYAKA